MEPPRTISVSQVNAYLGCPLKYRFQYVDKIPRPWRVAAMAFGSSVHAAVSLFFASCARKFFARPSSEVNSYITPCFAQPDTEAYLRIPIELGIPVIAGRR